MLHFWLSLAAVVFIALVHLVVGRMVGRLDERVRSRLLSIAGGISIAYVFTHLLPEVAHGQRAFDKFGHPVLIAFEHHSFLVALLGLLVFHGIERSVARRTGDGANVAQSRAVFWPHLLVFVVYNAIIGYLLAHREAEPAVVVIHALGLALHLMVVDHALDARHGRSYARWGRFVLAGALLAGWGLAAAVSLPEVAVVSMTAVLAGGIFYNVIKEEIPAEEGSRFWTLLAGALLYALSMSAARALAG